MNQFKYATCKERCVNIQSLQIIVKTGVQSGLGASGVSKGGIPDDWLPSQSGQDGIVSSKDVFRDLNLVGVRECFL
jgi:hypothetical protein